MLNMQFDKLCLVLYKLVFFFIAPSIEPAMPRRKKYPGLAYKTNEIFEAAAAGLPSGMASSGMSSFGGVHTLDRARVIV